MSPGSRVAWKSSRSVREVVASLTVEALLGCSGGAGSGSVSDFGWPAKQLQTADRRSGPRLGVRRDLHGGSACGRLEGVALSWLEARQRQLGAFSALRRQRLPVHSELVEASVGGAQ